MWIVILSLLFGVCIFSVNSHEEKSKFQLNETKLSNNRYVVENFASHIEMTLLETFLQKHKYLFQWDHNKYGLRSSSMALFGYAAHLKGQESLADADETLKYLNQTTDSSEHFYGDEYIKMLHNYVKLRDRIFKYVEDVFNATDVTLLTREDGIIDSGYFYFFTPNQEYDIQLNGIKYLMTPHVDTAPFVSFDRPLLIDKRPPYFNPYRKYSAILYFDSLPATTGGDLLFIDLPNKEKSPHSQMKPLSSTPGCRDYSGGAFADADGRITRVSPARGKLVVFKSHTEIHAVEEYRGSSERWAFNMFLTDKATNELYKQSQHKRTPS